MNCLIRYPCDSEKYEKNNLTYHSWITPCGVIEQNCMEYWYEPAESDFRTKRKKKTGIIHKQSLKRDDTRNLTFCDYYCFCRKFCFVLALKSDEMVKSLCSGKVCIWRKDVIFMRSPQGRIQKIQIAVAGKLASYMDSYYFATVIEQIIQKSTEKKEGWRRPLGHPLNLPVVPMGLYNPVISVVIRQHPPSHACILWISNLDSIFFPFPAPQCSPFKYLSLWLLNPQSLPSNEASPGYQTAYWSKLSHWALPHSTQNCTRS